MSTSYSGDPTSSPKDAVRFWIEDKGPTSWLLSDEEINYVLTLYSTPIMAAAQCCRAIAAQFAQKVNKRVGDLSINYSDKNKHYLDLADSLEMQASTVGIIPYAGGTSRADKEVVASNSDRPRPPFREHQFDNRQAGYGQTPGDWTDESCG